MTLSTKDRLLDAGLTMILERGYNHLGIQDVLAATGVPKGSFYHHFESKEDFGLQVIDRYMTAVHAGLDECLGDQKVEPLQRVRNFFEATREKYREEGYLGCLLGGLGQELGRGALTNVRPPGPVHSNVLHLTPVRAPYFQSRRQESA